MDIVKKLHLGDKAVPLIIAFIAVVVVGVIAIKYYKNRDIVSSQRTACMIYVEGPCTVMREGATINATSEMPLYSGDTIYTGVDASARIRLDNDKFLYLDATTRINLTATGTPENSHTLVYVEAGSMLTEVKETLADGSTFDIVTPNTSTAIHGTEVITQVEVADDGKTTTNIGFSDGMGTFSVIERAADGTLCISENAIQAGEAVGVSTSALGLLLGADTKSIVLTGRAADGTVARTVQLGNLGAEIGPANFNGRFITNAKAILEQSHQEDNTDASGSINNFNHFVNNARASVPSGVLQARREYEDDASANSAQGDDQTQNNAQTPSPAGGDDEESENNADPAQPAQNGNQQPVAQTPDTVPSLVQIPDDQTPAPTQAQQNQDQNQGGGNSGGGDNSGGGGSGGGGGGPSTPPSPSQGNTSDEHPHGEDIDPSDPYNGDMPPVTEAPTTTDTGASGSDDPGTSGSGGSDDPDPSGSGSSSSETPSVTADPGPGTTENPSPGDGAIGLYG